MKKLAIVEVSTHVSLQDLQGPFERKMNGGGFIASLECFDTDSI